MGKAIVLVFFVLAFIVFAIIKAVFFGVKEAYKAVFDPNSGEKEIIKVLGLCSFAIDDIMEKHYDGNLNNLSGLIFQLTPMVQSTILEHGYQTTREMAEHIVKSSIILSGYATEDEIERA